MRQTLTAALRLLARLAVALLAVLLLVCIMCAAPVLDLPL